MEVIKMNKKVYVIFDDISGEPVQFPEAYRSYKEAARIRNKLIELNVLPEWDSQIVAVDSNLTTPVYKSRIWESNSFWREIKRRMEE